MRARVQTRWFMFIRICMEMHVLSCQYTCSCVCMCIYAYVCVFMRIHVYLCVIGCLYTRLYLLIFSCWHRFYVAIRAYSCLFVFKRVFLHTKMLIGSSWCWTCWDLSVLVVICSEGSCSNPIGCSPACVCVCVCVCVWVECICVCECMYAYVCDRSFKKVLESHWMFIRRDRNHSKIA